MERLQQLEPELLARRRATLRSVSITGAATTLAISLAILLLYASHDAGFYQAHRLLFQMTANPALGFAAAGGSLLALLHGRRRWSAALAAVPLLIGGLTLLEYLGVAIPIDQLLISDWPATTGPMPGRPPPNSATILLLSGGVVLLLLTARREATRRLALLLVPIAIVAVAIEALAGQVGQSAFAVGWWSGRPMSIPSALCALSLGAAMLAQGWQDETAVISRLPLWLPALGYFAIALFDVSTPLEVNAGLCYAPLVACALWFQRAYLSVALAAMATLLIVFGLFASPPGHIPFDVAVVNRSFAIAGVWLVAALVYAQHITRRDLRRCEHHFATAQSIASIGSFELHFSDMVLTGSSAFQALHGLPEDTTCDWATFLRTSIPLDERGTFDGMIAAAKAGQDARDLDYSYLRHDDDVHNAVMHVDLLLDSLGKPVGIIGVVHDVTALRRAEVQQADIEVQLRHAQKLESLGMFAGGIAHDLNNTLVPITTLAPLLMESSDPAGQQILEVMIGCAKRARDLVREMLAFSRKEEAAPEPIRLDQLVREAMTIIRAGIPTNIAVVDELAQVPPLLGSKGQIYQTILNLATNAAQAIGDRPGTITIGSSSEPGGAGDTANVRLFVADDGPGMDVATARRVFEPYFSTKPTAGGTGLGLAIVNKIVKSHGGTILVRSAPAKGTRFDLLFPAMPQQAAQG
ncbi:ATP-binding protein [Sphingomonas sp. AR_OL41]|uniref:PAS domain-containing sensor histidine kinase n=1 Tax=Sphingomonas sp. AR_OL41 TaxID=3042729 RepID=UPI00247FD499|nr:PAS domain-containing sensor histidine kinase [Sphingomonas sp. AR_OL41]MDH7975029.1 ATP-binding protein [Sphingomonas sp. AR_OL41]